MGEDPAAVHVVGAPGLDNASRADLPDRDALAADLGLALAPPLVLVTVHPATLDADPAAAARAVAAAMDRVPATYVITRARTSTPARTRSRAIVAAAADEPGRIAVEALGERRYWGLLRIADAMLGNSSSGLIEAPAVGLPVVNVGDRQAGRERGPNVIDVPADAAAIAEALARALVPGASARAWRAAPATPPTAVPGPASRISSPHGDRRGPRASRRSACRRDRDAGS